MQRQLNRWEISQEIGPVMCGALYMTKVAEIREGKMILQWIKLGQLVIIWGKIKRNLYLNSYTKISYKWNKYLYMNVNQKGARKLFE